MQFDSTIMFQIILDSDSICNCSCFMLSFRMTGKLIGHLSKESDKRYHNSSPVDDNNFVKLMIGYNDCLKI